MRAFLILATAAVASVHAKNPYSCGANKPQNNFHYRGTALGGWLVLEPWITPSLFYQFLGASEKWGDDAKNRVAMDSKSFCTALGKEEANRQLRNHWKAWVTEEEIAKMASYGVDTLRIPVGDWMYVPYEPYNGCWDGSLDELQRILDLCTKYNIKALIDVHGMKDSQNGLDNSGETMRLVWLTKASENNVTRFKHWDAVSGNWIAPYDFMTQTFGKTNYDNIEHSLKVVETIIKMYRDNPTVVGIEPVNEPWKNTPIPPLRDFYWQSYQLVQKYAPQWVTLLHDSFRLDPAVWGYDFMENCSNYAFDTHIYQAWSYNADPEWYLSDACAQKYNIERLEKLGFPVVVGEWSLATDNCAMWLNGFNDNLDGFPKVECKRVTCPAPYMGDQPGAPPDVTKGRQDPFGQGESYVEFGTCPIDKPFDNEDEMIRKLTVRKLHAFDSLGHGQFFWNFRTELEARWSFIEAVERQWFPTDWDDVLVQEEILNSCPSTPPPAPISHKSMGLLIPLLIVGILGFLLHYTWQRCKESQGYERVSTEEGAEMTRSVRMQYS